MDYNQFNCVYVVVEGARPKIGRNMRGRGNYLFRLAPSGSSLSVFFPSPCPTKAAILARKADLTAAYVQHTLNIIWTDDLRDTWIELCDSAWRRHEVSRKSCPSQTVKIQRTLWLFVTPQPSSMNTRPKRNFLVQWNWLSWQGYLKLQNGFFFNCSLGLSF